MVSVCIQGAFVSVCMHATLFLDSVHLVLSAHVRLTQHFDRVPVGTRGAVVSVCMQVKLVQASGRRGERVCMHVTLVQASA